jgi:hypothetical protein
MKSRPSSEKTRIPICHRAAPPTARCKIDAIGRTRDFLTGALAPVHDAYHNLRNRFAVLSRLAEIQQTMVMDAELFMPADEASHRQDQMTTLGTVSNLLIADPQVEKWLDESEKHKASLAAAAIISSRVRPPFWLTLRATGCPPPLFVLPPHSEIAQAYGPD